MNIAISLGLHKMHPATHLGLAERLLVAGESDTARGLIAPLSPVVASFPPAVNVSSTPTIRCAWCEKTMREGTTNVSHSICPDCRDRLEQEVA